ncbi:thioredoxin family protein [Butyricimonas hominis]|uniref:thioredoxin family protein n=1 Tax=Butyricimonas TaxID=574697 RepID=UPI003511E7BF
MKKYLLLVLVFVGLSLGGFSQGIEFRTESFEEVVKMAAKQGKWVFVDAYGPKCPPCRRMEKEVFPDPKVGEFFNKHFLCLKIDATTQEQELMDLHRVGLFPTYLFFDGAGNLKYRAKGFFPVDEFIAEGQKALDEAKLKSYEHWMAGFALNGSVTTFGREFAIAMMQRGISLAEGFERYWATQQLHLMNTRGIKEWEDNTCHATVNANDFIDEIDKRKQKEDDLYEAERRFSGPKRPLVDKAYPILVAGDTLVKNILTLMQGRNAIQMKDYALRNKNRELFDYALALWEQLPESTRVGEREALELEFLQATGETKKYVKEAARFLNRVVETMSQELLLVKGKEEAVMMPVWGIQAEWQERFEEMYCDLYFNYVESIARQCMAYSKSAKQLPDLARWAEYARQLKPGNVRAQQFYNDVTNWK